MVVTVDEVVTLLQGDPNGVAAPNDGYIIYDKYNIRRTKIEYEITIVTRYAEEDIPSDVQTQKADLFDDLILTEVCYRILAGHIMGMIMATGFSFTTLELTVNTSMFPAVLKNAVDSFRERRDNLRFALKSRVKLLPQYQMGTDPYHIQEYFMRDTVSWRQGGGSG